MQKIILGALIYLLCGCFPINESYFEPSSEGLVAHKQICHNEIGPLSAIDFDGDVGHIVISAKHTSDRKESVSLALRFNVASIWVSDGLTRHAQYKGDESMLYMRPSSFVAYGATSEISLKITPRKIRQVIRGNGVDHPLLPIVQLKATSPSHGDTWYILYFDIEVNNTHQFSVIVPQFTIDGKTSVSRTIHFVEKNGTWVEPLNC